MGVLSSTGQFFSLDVLDGQNRKKDPQKATKLRWQTPEFYFYYLIFLLCVPLMFKSVVDISSPEHPNYLLYENLLEDGLISGRKVDNSDTQYASFRNQIPTLFLVLAGHLGLRHLFDFLLAGARKEKRLRFDVLFGMIFLFVIHGFGAVKLLAISSFSYAVARIGKDSLLNPVLTWATVIALLFTNEWYQGYKFSALHPALANLDTWSGLLDRWHIHFNITALRLISYNLDYYWSFKTPAKEETKQTSPAELTDRERVEIPAVSHDFNYLNFLSYAFYSPLYLAGPIITFNNYVAQAGAKPSTITRSRTVQYALRLAVSILCMELVLHYIYVVAMSKSHAWNGLSPMQISMLGYFNLHIIWLKLLIPWRFFRLWAMADEMETTENMLRCMSNNYSALAFWRAWHRSFNRWILRYIYIPLGGANTIPGTIVNMLAVFTFVAIWHDISLTLLTWGWLVVVFLLPEMLVTQLCRPLRNKWYYRYVCGVGAVANILMMMAANLVGFCVGLDGLKDMVAQIFGSASGFAFLAIASGALFVGVQVMFQVRDDEATRGIDLRC